MNNTTSHLSYYSDERPPMMKRPRISTDDTVCLECHDEMSTCTNKNILESSSLAVSSEVWGLVCDFLPYESLLSMAATSRTMLHEVMPLVTMLHINKSTQIHAGIARTRYRDVRDIYIYSLIDYTPPDQLWGEEDEIDEINDIITIDSDTADRVVPFLCHFGKLERVFLGGQRRISGRVEGFLPTGNVDNEEKDRIKLLIDAFSGAFRAGALSNNLWLLGLRCPRSNRTTNMFGLHSCRTCINACKSFPLESVANKFENEGSSNRHVLGNWRFLQHSYSEQLYSLDVCLTVDQIEDIITKRAGGREMLYSESRFLSLLGNGTRIVVVNDSDEKELYVVKYDEKELGEIIRFIEKGQLDVQNLSPDVVLQSIKRSFAADERDALPPREQCYLAENSFYELKRLILPIDEADFLNEDEWDGKKQQNDDSIWRYNWRFS